MSKIKNIDVEGISITVNKKDDEEFICITDIAKYKNPNAPRDIIKNWMRNKNTIELLGLWERLNNPDFKQVEFDLFKNEAGFNHFVLSPKKWIETTHAIGLQSKSGRYGGTYAHIDIALEFASWVSVEFKFFMIKEFQRLKNIESKTLDWNIKRNLTKINYRIHTDAIKENLIPQNLSPKQTNFAYANEADVLNMALFAKTAKQWRDESPDKKGNISLTVLGNLSLVVPNNDLINKWKILINPIYFKLNNNAMQIQNSILTRDTLLPKLMSGEIRVNLSAYPAADEYKEVSI